ncbi:MAG: ribonuclease Z [Deltaproteobacteria bacterium]|nr:MAG: ribonuclease Z [Deltaproteobacteria bacterium]
MVDSAFIIRITGGERMAQLVVLGSGTGVPSLRRASPGLLLLSGSSKILIDSGSGTLRRMLEAGTAYQDLGLLLYTHIHPDHVADLVPILFASKYSRSPRKEDLLCVGGPGFKDYVEKVKAVYGAWIEPQSYRLTIEEMGEKPLLFRDVEILSKPMAHIRESVGYRIEFQDGATVVVSGDTDYCQAIVDLGFRADLLVLESSFPDGKKVEGHLTPSLAGRIGTESRCKRLLLTHLYPECDRENIIEQCKKTFEGEVLLAEDLMRIEV